MQKGQDNTHGRARPLALDSINATWTLVGLSRRWCTDGKACHISIGDRSAVRESGVCAEVDDVGQVGHLASWRACVCARLTASTGKSKCTMIGPFMPLAAQSRASAMSPACCRGSPMPAHKGHGLLAHMLLISLHNLYSSMQTPNLKQG